MNRSVRFPDELVPRIQAEADRLERSFNWVVVRTLEKALAAQMKAPELSEPTGASPSPASPRTPEVAIPLYTRMARDQAETVVDRAKVRVERESSVSSVPMFVCRHGDFRAASPKARCPRHGGALIPE